MLKLKNNFLNLLSLGLFLILCCLVTALISGKNGVLEYIDIQADIKTQQEQNQKLQKRNDHMFAEIDDLRQGLAAIEERARNELGMVRKGETFFRITTPPATQTEQDDD